jgi:hypothetical protein
MYLQKVISSKTFENNLGSELPVHPSDEEQQERLLDILTAVDLRGDGVGQLVIQLLNHHHIVFIHCLEQHVPTNFAVSYQVASGS